MPVEFGPLVYITPFIIRCLELETKMGINEGKRFETFDMIAPGVYFDLL